MEAYSNFFDVAAEYNPPSEITDTEEYQEEGYEQEYPDDNYEQEEYQEDYQQKEQPDDFWTAPEGADTEWYQNKIEELKDYISSSYERDYQEHVQSELARASEQIKDYQEVYLAMTRDPKGFLMQYIPEALVEYGISPVMSNEQIAQKVEQDMVSRFGDYYQSRFNASDMLNPLSESARIFTAQQQLYNKYSEMNERNQALLHNWNKQVANGQAPYQQQQQQLSGQTIEQAYQNFQDHMDYDTYNQFVQDANNYQMQPMDYHKVVYFNDYIEAAYEEGMRAAQGNLYQQLQFRGNGQVQRAEYPQARMNDEYQTSNQHIVNTLSKGGIPYY